MVSSPLELQWTHSLHEAAANGDTPTLTHLLEEGHSPETRGGQECWLRGATSYRTRTPLHYSAKGGHLECIRVLLKYGADPNSVDIDGYTPVHYVCQIHNPGNGIHQIIRLCLLSLLDFGGDWRLKTLGGRYTPLDIARQQRNSVCIHELLKQGALIIEY